MKHARPQAREQQIETHAYTEENVTTVDELVRLSSQEDQKQTLRSTRHGRYPQRRV